MMKVCVQGLWHLGSVTAACLASVGHQVVGWDPEFVTIDGMNRGQAPIFEPGLDDAIRAGLANGKLSFSSDAEHSVSDVQVLWVAFDTPVDEEDQADVTYVVNQVQAVLPHLPAGAVVLVSSQMPVGSIRKLEAFAKEKLHSKRIQFAYSPENLRLGKALDVFLKPDRIVVGVRNSETRRILEDLIRPITARVEWMSVESAEMTKHAINAFLATSVTFANEVAAICELVGADAKDVERGLKTESRIGPRAYVSPGGPFAGGTLARDITFLNLASHAHQLSTPLLSAVRPSNDEHKNWVRRKLHQQFESLAGVAVAIWGLTYKPGTDTLRRSLSVEVCNWLLEQGATVWVFDPAVKQLPAQWSGRVNHCGTALDALAQAQALVIGTEWPEFKHLTSGLVANAQPGLVVVDANRHLDAKLMPEGVKYISVGTPLALGGQI